MTLEEMIFQIEKLGVASICEPKNYWHIGNFIKELKRARAEIECLNKEADWLVDYLSQNECPYTVYSWEKDSENRPRWCDWHYDVYGYGDCSGESVECWRKVARKKIEESEKAQSNE